MKVAEYLPMMLKEYGTTHIFYEEMLFPALMRKAEDLGIRPIIAHSEFGAAYMADGYARTSHKPGICMAQAIGAPNLAAGLHDAWLACIPLIAITGKRPPIQRYRNAYQDSDHIAAFGAFTKFSADVVDPNQLPILLRQAYRESVSGKPRPVHFDILGFGGIELEGLEVDAPLVVNKEYSVYPPFKPAAAKEAIATAAKEIASAQRPVIIAGRGAIIGNAQNAITDLITKADIPLITTNDGKCIIDESSPYWYGIVGGYGMDCANKIVSKSDLVIYVGSQISDMSSLAWTVPDVSTRVIQIDIDGSEIGRNYPNCLALFGDAGTVAAQLADAVAAGKHDTWRKECDALVKDTLDKQAARCASNSTPIDPARLCHEVSKALPDNAVLVSDTGWSAVWSSTFIRMKASQKYIRAAGTLGWSYPASLGAKCAAPDRPVVNFTGDGAFYYCMSEMSTAMKYGINTVTVINNNESFAQCYSVIADSDYKDDDQRAQWRFGFNPLNFAEIAKGFGLHAVRVTESAKIGPAITEALAAGKPALVEVCTSLDGPLPAMEK